MNVRLLTPRHHQTHSDLARAVKPPTQNSHMEEGRAHEEVAPAAPRGRRLARPVFLAAVALALFSFVAIVSGGEISSGLQQMRDVIGARERVPIARRRLRGAEARSAGSSL